MTTTINKNDYYKHFLIFKIFPQNPALPTYTYLKWNNLLNYPGDIEIIITLKDKPH